MNYSNLLLQKNFIHSMGLLLKGNTYALFPWSNVELINKFAIAYGNQRILENYPYDLH